jgi:uncharacterized membrane protein
MKGIAVETILYAIILVIALVLLVLLIKNLIPTFGNLVSSSLNGLLCSTLHFGC